MFEGLHLFRASLIAMCIAVPLLAGCSGQPALPDEITSFQEAMAAVSSGDKVKGMELLNACIEAKPTNYALFERAKLHLDAKNIPAAIKDCEQGLQLEPTDRDLKWLLAELKKPEQQRFKGANASSPRARK
jgi:hypothetical protein